MNRRKLAKIKKELEALAASPSGIKPTELIGLAKKLGRTKKKRGKEPTYEREDNPRLFPALTIPNHGGKELKKITAASIIEHLLNDVDLWELHLEGFTKRHDKNDKSDEL